MGPRYPYEKYRNVDEYRQRDRHPESGDGHDVLPDPRFIEPMAHRWVVSGLQGIGIESGRRGLGVETELHANELPARLDFRMLYELKEDQIVPPGSAAELRFFAAGGAILR